MIHDVLTKRQICMLTLLEYTENSQTRIELQ